MFRWVIYLTGERKWRLRWIEYWENTRFSPCFPWWADYLKKMLWGGLCIEKMHGILMNEKNNRLKRFSACFITAVTVVGDESISKWPGLIVEGYMLDYSMPPTVTACQPWSPNWRRHNWCRHRSKTDIPPILRVGLGPSLGVFWLFLGS